jgi:hypothetical protein
MADNTQRCLKLTLLVGEKMCVALSRDTAYSMNQPTFARGDVAVRLQAAWSFRKVLSYVFIIYTELFVGRRFRSSCGFPAHILQTGRRAARRRWRQVPTLVLYPKKRFSIHNTYLRASCSQGIN